MLASNAFIAVFGLFASTSLALPQYTQGDDRGLAGLQLPSTPLATPLPAPTGLTLTYLTLGVGTQNYSCTAEQQGTDPPTALGAVANLYDIGNIKPFSTLKARLSSIPAQALNASASTRPFSSQMQLLGVRQQIGKHFFNSAGVPNFDLFAANPPSLLEGSKVFDVAAPAGAYSGLRREGAVDWLRLDATTGSTGPVKAVYRVNTAGGDSALACSTIGGGDGKAANQEVRYAAEYWFYT